jgi:glycogen(starch) synthase
MRVVRLCSVFGSSGDVEAGDPRFDPVGGLQTHTGELTRALDSAGVSQCVVTSRPPGRPRREQFAQRSTVARLGLPVPLFRQGYAAPSTVLVHRVAARADLIHAHLGEDLAVVPIALSAARRYGLPLVLTVHTSLTHTLTSGNLRSTVLKHLGGWWERQGTRAADAVITLTPRLSRLVTAEGTPPERVHVIPSGVRAELFDTAEKTAEEAAGNAAPSWDVPGPVVLFLGRLHRQKGVDVLLRAFTSMPGATLVLAGDGPERGRLERLAHELGLRSRVRFLGFVPHDRVPGLLRSSDVLVLPSRYEELGTAMVEGMYAGLPVVASDTGGVPELVEHDGSGLLVPPGQPAPLADAMNRLLGDKGLAGRFGSRGRQLAQSYRWEALAGKVLDVYRGVIDDGSATVPG